MPVHPPRPTPFLPPELWFHIFKFATWAPRDAEAYIGTHFHDTGAWWGRRHPDLKPAMLTRRSLVKVCREWRALATPLLYEHIMIGRQKFVLPLCYTIVASKREAKSTKDYYHPLGWWTKRLDVAIRGADRHLNFKALSDIIRCLPNLTVIVFSVSFQHYCEKNLPFSVLKALSDTCSSNLREVYWTKFVMLPAEDEWKSFLARSPGLRRLGPMYAHWRASSGPPVTMPFLTGLTIIPHSVEINASDDDFNHYPSLQELVYTRDNKADGSTWEPLLRASGHNLTRVVLSRPDKAILQEELNVLARHCPNLVRLDIGLRNWNSLFANLVLPPVLILGLQSRVLCTKSAPYIELFTTLTLITAPALKTVRFLDHRIVNYLRAHHPRPYAYGIARLTSAGYHAEDHEGVRLL